MLIDSLSLNKISPLLIFISMKNYGAIFANGEISAPLLKKFSGIFARTPALVDLVLKTLLALFKYSLYSGSRA